MLKGFEGVGQGVGGDGGHPVTAMSNVVLTPHIGGATYDVESKQAAIVVADIKAILSGDKPLHCANPEVLQ